MIVNKKTTASLLDLLQRAATQLEDDFGPDDLMASELRDMHRELLGVKAPKKKFVPNALRTPEQLAEADRAKRAKLSEISKRHVKERMRDRNGHFIKMP